MELGRGVKGPNVLTSILAETDYKGSALSQSYNEQKHLVSAHVMLEIQNEKRWLQAIEGERLMTQ